MMTTFTNLLRMMMIGVALLVIAAMFIVPVIGAIGEIGVNPGFTWLSEWREHLPQLGWKLLFVIAGVTFIVLGSILAYKKVDIGKSLVWVGILTFLVLAITSWFGEEELSDAGKVVGCSISGGGSDACQELGRKRLGLPPALPVAWYGRADGETYVFTGDTWSRFEQPDGYCVWQLGGSNLSQMASDAGNWVQWKAPAGDSQHVVVRTLKVGQSWHGRTCR